LEFFIDGKKFGGIQNIELVIDEEEKKELSFNFPREISISMSDVKTNMRIMSPETRKWCKQIKVNGLIYW
jgi:sporulation protein YlmC with PRC-barrel domain